RRHDDVPPPAPHSFPTRRSSDLFLMTKNPLDAPGKPAVVQIGFEEGTPVSVDHVPLGPVELLETLNDVAAEHGVGRADVVEDRLDRKSTRLNSSHVSISYAVFCL